MAYTVSKDQQSGLWYAHQVGFPYIPVFGSFSERKSTAIQYVYMMEGKPHKINQKGAPKDEAY